MSSTPKSDFLKIMIERGFVADCTDYEGLERTLSIRLDCSRGDALVESRSTTIPSVAKITEKIKIEMKNTNEK